MYYYYYYYYVYSSRCFEAEEASAALSCTDGPYSTDQSCPAPPQVVIDENDIENISPQAVIDENDIENLFDDLSGPLDSDNTFVAEYLLRKADDLVRSVFFQRYQAGFVFGYNEQTPETGICQLSDVLRAPGNTSQPSSTVVYGNYPARFYLAESSSRNLTATIWYNNQVRPYTMTCT